MANINKQLAIGSNILRFSDQDLEDVYSPYDDALVVKAQLSNALVSRVLVNNGLGASVFFKDVAEKLEILDNINKRKTTIQFQRGTSTISRNHEAGCPGRTYNHLVTFHVMDCPTLHNAILRRNWLHKMNDVTSSYH